LLLALVTTATVVAQQPGYDDPDAFAIYSTLLGNGYSVIRNTTKTFPAFGEGQSCLIAPKNLQPILNPLIKAYRDENKTPRLLTGKLSGVGGYQFVSEELLRQRFFSQDIDEGWDKFHKAFPTSGGIDEVSAVGFNSDRSIALVYYGHTCGGLCGSGRFYVFERKGDKWTKSKLPFSPCEWIS
ncbi:MAG: hypothetical protein ACJ73D_07405, partial [Pyrinomonadaceae bacterium]